MFWGVCKYVENLEGLPVPNREKKKLVKVKELDASLVTTDSITLCQLYSL